MKDKNNPHKRVKQVALDFFHFIFYFLYFWFGGGGEEVEGMARLANKNIYVYYKYM